MKQEGGTISIETRNLFSNQPGHGYDLEKNKRAEARPAKCSRESKNIL